MSRPIDADVLKRKAQKEATKSWKMKIVAKVETILNQFIDWIDNAPTIEPERKKGKWFWGDGMYSCDQCHAAFYETSPFCPMCGADMRGEQE